MRAGAWERWLCGRTRGWRAIDHCWSCLSTSACCWISPKMRQGNINIQSCPPPPGAYPHIEHSYTRSTVVLVQSWRGIDNLGLSWLFSSLVCGLRPPPLAVVQQLDAPLFSRQCTVYYSLNHGMACFGRSRRTLLLLQVRRLCWVPGMRYTTTVY